MSNDDGLTIWVGDLNGYINVDFSDEYEHELKELALEREMDEIGDISLFAGKAISSRVLLSRGVSPDRWRWAQHHAEKSLADAKCKIELELRFVENVNAMGRRYAVARYARFEGLSYSTALTATFRHGLRALLYQYIAREPLLGDSKQRPVIQKSLSHAIAADGLTAYDRAGKIRQTLHDIAILNHGPEGHLCLDKDGVKEILSLCRLHFSVLECDVHSLLMLQELDRLYGRARIEAGNGSDQGQAITGKYIRNWKMRHLHPLTFFFPYSLRNAVARGILQISEDPGSFDRCRIVNELALAHCGMGIMRENAKVWHT
jgi:hypothetical protein